jgi:hypothetical protein
MQIVFLYFTIEDGYRSLIFQLRSLYEVEKIVKIKNRT